MIEEAKAKTWYVAGPMTGIPQFNFPAFEAAAKKLRDQGFIVISPHEQDTPEVQKAAWASKDGKLDSAGKVAGLTWGQILAKDVELVADKIDGIIFLPDWWNSRGARLEAFTALLTGKKFATFTPKGYVGDYDDMPAEEDTLSFQFSDTIRDTLKRHMP